MARNATAKRNSPDSPPQRPEAVPDDPVTAEDLANAGSGTGPVGGTGEGPSGGPVGVEDPLPTPNPGPTPTPTPAPEPGGDGGPVDTGKFATEAAQALFGLLRSSNSPEAQEAEAIILRRLALQGDVIPSRVPPPLNITEIGGYLNLLTNLNELDMRSRVLAGILGVAGPTQPLDYIGSSTLLSLVPVVNDRPSGPWQAGLPVTVLVRSDFAGLLREALEALHAQGAQLPMMAGPYALPPAGGPVATLVDPLDYLGRTLRLAAATALNDAANDPLALVREAGTTGPFRLAARSDGSGTTEVPTADWEALQTAPGGITQVTLTGARFVPLAEALAATGFVPGGAPVTGPASAEPRDWAKWNNTAGLTATTRLDDELRLLHSQTEIAASALASKRNWHWTGSEFAP